MFKPQFISPIRSKSMFIRSALKWLLLTVLLNGCSSTSLVYNNANWLIRGEIDDYFPLTSLQQQQLKTNIDGIIQWHRKQELIEYADLINQFTLQYADGLTSRELNIVVGKVSSARIRLVEASIPTALQLLSTISIRQIDYYDQTLIERRDKQANKLDMSDEEYADENFSRFIDIIEQWFGDINKNQMAQLRVISDARPDKRQYWFERSKLKDQEFSALLRSRPDKEKIEQYLHDRFVELKQTDVQEHDNSLQVRLYWLNALLDIDQVIDTKQRKYFINRMTDYSSEFLELSKKSSKPVNPSTTSEFIIKPFLLETKTSY
jgi:hypothetical protein